MKKVILIILLLGIFSINSYSQNFNFHRISARIVHGDTSTFTATATYGILTNTGTTTQTFKLVRVVNNLPGSSWYSSMCLGVNCYPPALDTVPPRGAPSETLAPGQTDTLTLDVLGITPGMATVVIKAFVDGSPNVFSADTFRVQLGPVGISENNEIVKDYNLKQNYPNPFNPTTSINFSIPENSNVNLIVYNSAGKEVSKLLNNQFLRGGSYKYEFNADEFGLSSGVYFYELRTEKFQKTLKMVLIK